MSAADLPESALRHFLVEAGVMRASAAMTWRLLGGGRSNLTYLVDIDAEGYVLRRPPAGNSDPKAHDVTREYRILRALHPTGLPVPEAIVCCEDASILGGRFYLMRRVHGRVIESSASAPDLLDGASLSSLVDAVVDGLVALHRVDPASVGLEDLGKPQGYTARQVARWSKHWRTGEWRSIPALDEVARRLVRCVETGLPVDDEPPVIVHGDYNIGNLMIAHGRPVRLAAILDWEMTTLGHPLMDLGLLTTYNGPHMGRIFEVEDAISVQPGFPEPDVIAARYALKSGRSIELLDFFRALAFFKVLVLIEEVRARHLRGATSGEGYARLGESASQNAQALLAFMDGSSISALAD